MEYDYSVDEEGDLKYAYLCTADMESAQHIIRTIRSKTKADDPDKTIRYYLLQTLVVTYMRPFTTSRGRKLEDAEAENYKGRRTGSKKKGWFLAHRISKKEYVPEAFEGLHERLEVFRDQQFAHRDSNYFNVQIENLGSAEAPWWTFGLRGEELEYLDSHLSRIEELATVVQAKLKAELQAKLDDLKTRVVVEPTSE